MPRKLQVAVCRRAPRKLLIVVYWRGDEGLAWKCQQNLENIILCHQWMLKNCKADQNRNRLGDKVRSILEEEQKNKQEMEAGIWLHFYYFF